MFLTQSFENWSLTQNLYKRSCPSFEYEKLGSNGLAYLLGWNKQNGLVKNGIRKLYRESCILEREKFGLDQIRIAPVLKFRGDKKG